VKGIVLASGTDFGIFQGWWTDAGTFLLAVTNELALKEAIPFPNLSRRI